MSSHPKIILKLDIIKSHVAITKAIFFKIMNRRTPIYFRVVLIKIQNSSSIYILKSCKQNVSHFFVSPQCIHSTHGLVMPYHMVTQILITISSGKHLDPKPLLESMMTNYQKGLVAFIWEQIHGKLSRHIDDSARKMSLQCVSNKVTSFLH